MLIIKNIDYSTVLFFIIVICEGLKSADSSAKKKSRSSSTDRRYSTELSTSGSTIRTIASANSGDMSRDMPSASSYNIDRNSSSNYVETDVVNFRKKQMSNRMATSTYTTRPTPTNKKSSFATRRSASQSATSSTKRSTSTNKTTKSTRNKFNARNSGDFFPPSSSQNLVRNGSTNYVEIEVVNYKKNNNVFFRKENLSVAECNKGAFAPHTMKIYQNDSYRCNLACDNGCQMGFGAYEENPYVVPLSENRVTCYLIKVQANYKIKRFQKETRKGRSSDVNQCHCGLYFGPRFRYCSSANEDYADPDTHPLILNSKSSDGEQRLRCMLFCNDITAFVSLKEGRPYLADCCTHDREDNVIANRTYLLHGQCIKRNNDVKCICGVPTKQKAVFSWEDTLKRPNKNFRYVLNMSAPINEKDNRVYDLRKVIYPPVFSVLSENKLRDGNASKTDEPLQKVAKSKPGSGLITSDMSEGTKKFVRKKRSVETIHHPDSLPPFHVGGFSLTDTQVRYKDEDSVNQLAVTHAWISESDEETQSRIK